MKNRTLEHNHRESRGQKGRPFREIWAAEKDSRPAFRDKHCHRGRTSRYGGPRYLRDGDLITLIPPFGDHAIDHVDTEGPLLSRDRANTLNLNSLEEEAVAC